MRAARAGAFRSPCAGSRRRRRTRPRPCAGRAAGRSCPTATMRSSPPSPMTPISAPFSAQSGSTRVRTNRSPARPSPWKRRKRLRSERSAKKSTSAGTSPSTGGRRRSVVPSRRMTSTAMSESCTSSVIGRQLAESALGRIRAAAELVRGKPAVHGSVAAAASYTRGYTGGEWIARACATSLGRHDHEDDPERDGPDAEAARGGGADRGGVLERRGGRAARHLAAHGEGAFGHVALEARRQQAPADPGRVQGAHRGGPALGKPRCAASATGGLTAEGARGSIPSSAGAHLSQMNAASVSLPGQRRWSSFRSLRCGGVASWSARG